MRENVKVSPRRTPSLCPNSNRARLKQKGIKQKGSSKRETSWNNATERYVTLTESSSTVCSEGVDLNH